MGSCLRALCSPIYPFNFDVLIAFISITAMSGPGTLIRVFLQNVALYQVPYKMIVPSLLPNLCGCFIMGFHEGFARSAFVSRVFEDKYVKVGIATGLAGSVTTFSSFNFEIASLLIAHNPQIGRYVAGIAATFAGGIFMYFIGESIAKCIFFEIAVNAEPRLDEDSDDEDTDLNLDKDKSLSWDPRQSTIEMHGLNGYSKAISNVSTVSSNGHHRRSNEQSNGEFNGHNEIKEHVVQYDDEEEEHNNAGSSNSEREHLKSNGLREHLKSDSSPTDPVKDQSTTSPIKKDGKPTTATSTYMQDYCILMRWMMVLAILYGLAIPISFEINGQLWEGILLSPAGALLRWYLGKLFNKESISWMPLGTFFANIYGSCLFTVIHCISMEKGDVLWAYHEMTNALILTGFCGCLTTVSSFVHEKFTLKRNAKTNALRSFKEELWRMQHEAATYRWAVLYFFLTLLVAQFLTCFVLLLDAYAQDTW